MESYVLVTILITCWRSLRRYLKRVMRSYIAHWMQHWHNPKIARFYLILRLSSKFDNHIRRYRHLGGRVLSKNCAGIVGSSCYVYELNRSAKSKWQFMSCAIIAFSERYECIVRLKCDGTRAETRFRLSPKRTSPFKSAGRVILVDCWQPRCAHKR